jgi:hypothetical protein
MGLAIAVFLKECGLQVDNREDSPLKRVSQIMKIA